MNTRTPTQLRRAAGRLYDAAMLWREQASQHEPDLLIGDAQVAMTEGAELEALAIWIELHAEEPS